VPRGMSWLVRAGTEVRFSGARDRSSGARCYIAVAGGFSVPPVLGSRSTYLPGGFGGYSGRQLRAGDTLYANGYNRLPAELAGKSVLTSAVRTSAVTSLRFVPYVGRGSVAAELRERAIALEFEVSPASDRMGVRLVPKQEGALSWRGTELTSFGVVRGAIQLPPGGAPVVLGADHQTTGGYPLLGVISRADWSLVAQLKPGHKVRLQPITLNEARTARRPQFAS
jgi:antagonist of KipI